MGEGGVLIKAGLLQILFPPRCPICDRLLDSELIRIQQYIHPLCECKLHPVGVDICLHCGKPLQAEQEYCFDCKKKMGGSEKSFLEQGRSVYVYRGEICRSVYRFKYSNRREYAGFFAEKAAQRYGEWIAQCGIEAIVPVPMYRHKKRRRGYNQAEIFAKELAMQLSIPFVANGVKRIRDTGPQKLLSNVERKNNLKKAFQAEEFIVKYKCILIVDDIYTTGSTVEAVAEVMRRTGVERVFFLTLCTGEGI